MGNIYIGGTGKTPLVNNLASHFKKRFKTYIIKKNYTSHLDEKNLLESKHKVIFEKTRELSILKAENKSGLRFALGPLERFGSVFQGNTEPGPNRTY